MSPLELVALRKREPFEPFTLTLSDGRAFAITSPTRFMVGKLLTVVGIPGPSGENEHMALLNNCDIVRAEPDDTAPHDVRRD